MKTATGLVTRGMPTRAVFLLLLSASAAAQSQPPLRLELERTIDASSGVSFGSITRLDVALDGSVAVVDDGNNRIYRFHPTGRLRDSLGGKGQGPGEFLAAAGIALGPAGEVVLADVRTRRLTFWSPDGRLLRSAPLPGGLPTALLWRGAEPVIGTLVYGDTVQVGFFPVRFGNGETAGPWIGRFAEPVKRQYSTAVSCSFCRHGLTPEGKLLLAAPDTFYRVSEVDEHGRVLRRWSRSDVGAGLRDPEEASALAARIRAGPGGGAPTKESGARPPAGSELRHQTRFHGIGIDTRGRLLTLVSNAGSTRPVVDVFAAGGAFLGSVPVAERLLTFVIRGNRIAAVGETADGEPVVYVYRIVESQ